MGERERGMEKGKKTSGFPPDVRLCPAGICLPFSIQEGGSLKLPPFPKCKTNSVLRALQWLYLEPESSSSLRPEPELRIAGYPADGEMMSRLNRFFVRLQIDSNWWCVLFFACAAPSNWPAVDGAKRRETWRNWFRPENVHPSGYRVLASVVKWQHQKILRERDYKFKLFQNFPSTCNALKYLKV